MFENQLKNKTIPLVSSLPEIKERVWYRYYNHELEMIKQKCTVEQVENEAKRKQEFEMFLLKEANNQINEAANRQIKINLYNTLVNTVQNQQVDCALIDNNIYIGNNINKIILAQQQNQNINNSFNNNISINISNISIYAVNTMENEEKQYEFTNSNKIIKQLISVVYTLEGFCEYFSNLVDQRFITRKLQNSTTVESLKMYMEALQYICTAFDITIAQGQILYQKHSHALSLETKSQIKSHTKITEYQ
ncbi:Hypothetical_protein [Hexamita inflata]|uniref:Hypothetical_protein n=1 Tax=Hexamita inflata TaxID=28002 RepID=A0AA86R1G2_9EUKA|nr:Hypothetical protein HINF_LOCUS27529 [Hexamita inflata]CAI9963874.1 Hypothetical protein HINF_LOCUS51519 [Hexamita inflata]